MAPRSPERSVWRWWSGTQKGARLPGRRKAYRNHLKLKRMTRCLPFRFAPIQTLGQPTLTELAALVTRMLDMDPQNRPSSMADVQKALERLEDQRRHPSVP